MGNSCLRIKKRNRAESKEATTKENLEGKIERIEMKMKNQESELHLKKKNSKKKSGNLGVELKNNSSENFIISENKAYCSSKEEKLNDYSSSKFFQQQVYQPESVDLLIVASEDDILIDEDKIKKFLHLDSNQSNKIRRKVDLENEVWYEEEEVSMSELESEEEDMEKKRYRKSCHMVKVKKQKTGTTKCTDLKGSRSRKNSAISDFSIKKDETEYQNDNVARRDNKVKTHKQILGEGQVGNQVLGRCVTNN